MYNHNSTEGKLARIEELKKYINLIGEVPGDHISYLDARGISQYLIDIMHDLEKQVNPTPTRHRNKLKKYRYHFIDEDICIFADNGDEAHEMFKKFSGKEEPSGNIEVLNLLNGETNMMYPVKFSDEEVIK